MGVFSRKYKFHLNGKDWCVHLQPHWYSRSFMVTIDGLTVANIHQNISKFVAVLRCTKLNVLDDGHSYDLEIAPVSAWNYGVHVYRDGALIHRYKDRDFVTLTKHEKFSEKLDRMEHIIADDRPFWKIMTEGFIIGIFIYTICALALNFMEAKNIIDSAGKYTPLIIVLVMVFVLFRPTKLRLFK